MDLSVLFISEHEDESFHENINPEDFLPDSINISFRLNGEDGKISENAADSLVLVEHDHNSENIASRLNGEDDKDTASGTESRLFVNLDQNADIEVGNGANSSVVVDKKFRICNQCSKKIRRIRYQEHKQHCGSAKTCKLGKDGVMCGAKYRTENQHIKHCRYKARPYF